MNYSTFADAKIANPDSEIYESMSGDFANADHVSLVAMCGAGEGWNKCDPADYCMTVGEYLTHNEELPIGGLVIHMDTSTHIIGEAGMADCCSRKLGSFIIEPHPLLESPEETEAFDVMAQDNEAAEAKADAEYETPYLTVEDSPRGIVSRISDRLHNIGCGHQEDVLADELESFACELWNLLPHLSNQQPQPKHTKEEYVKVTETIFGLEAEFERGELYHLPNVTNNFKMIDTLHVLCMCAAQNAVYRKVETELTERERFVQIIRPLQDAYILDDTYSDEEFGEFLYDSGKVKLVDE